jgi:hypothetical protein
VKLAGLEKLISFVEASIEQVKTFRVGENQLQVSTFSSDALCIANLGSFYFSDPVCLEFFSSSDNRFEPTCWSRRQVIWVIVCR